MRPIVQALRTERSSSLSPPICRRKLSTNRVSRAEDSLERERREAPARRGAEIAVGGVADERTICGCKQRHVTIEPPCPHGDHADRSRTATERRTADSRPQPRSATLPHDVKAGFNVGMGETGDIRVLDGSSGEPAAAAPAPAEGREPRSIGGCIDAVPAALEAEVCPAQIREPSAAWVFPSHRGGKGCRPGREEAVVLHVRDAGLDAGGDLRANRMECGAARQAEECARPHGARGLRSSWLRRLAGGPAASGLECYSIDPDRRRSRGWRAEGAITLYGAAKLYEIGVARVRRERQYCGGGAVGWDAARHQVREHRECHGQRRPPRRAQFREELRAGTCAERGHGRFELGRRRSRSQRLSRGAEISREASNGEYDAVTGRTFGRALERSFDERPRGQPRPPA